MSFALCVVAAKVPWIGSQLSCFGHVGAKNNSVLPCGLELVIYLNGTSPSECRHPSCWHTKGHLWIEVFPKQYRLAYYMIHSSSIQLITFPFYYVDLYSRLSFYATRESFVSVPYSKSRMDVFAGCSYSKSQIIHRLSFYIPMNISLNI